MAFPLISSTVELGRALWVLHVTTLKAVSLWYLHIYFINCLYFIFISNLSSVFCSGGDELNSLILNDLYYHLQGELEGRKIGSGAFRELSLYLIESEIFYACQHNYEGDIFVTTKDAYLFDLVRIQADLGLGLWEYSKWKQSKAIAARMLSCMEDVNSMMLVTRSKLTALRALITLLTLISNNVSLECSNRFFVVSDKRNLRQIIIIN